ncbi:MAG: MFS transporter [Cryomorphaceae bacterium]|nr:MFS transporter [Cryomorphaceae bacterium]
MSNGSRSFLYFVSIAYLTQGIAQHFGLVSQPLDYFMLKGLGKNAADVAQLLTILMLPWMVKPFYGIISDFFPLFGYRRKSYLFISYCAAGIFFVFAALAKSFNLLMAALFTTALGMSMATAILCGLTLEVGRPTNHYRRFQSIQAICYYSANLVAFLVGGWLCTYFAPEGALRLALGIAAIPCIVSAAAAWLLVHEPISPPTKRFTRSTIGNVIKEFRSRGLLMVGLFLCCWSFSPSFGTPLYFYETKVLGFSQMFIGQLGAINAIGMLAGSFVFMKYLDFRFSPRVQTVLSVLLGTLSTLGYLLLSSETSAILLEFFRGFANIIAILAIYGLAADVSPKKLESTTIATLIAAYNIAEQLSNILGARLYTYTFGEAFSPLIVVSAAATLACLVLIPLLPTKDLHA